MKLEDMCCSLEQAKRLKELGVNAAPHFYFFEDEGDIYARQNGLFSGFTHEGIINMADGNSWTPAYTAGELGVMLPWEYNNKSVMQNAASDAGQPASPTSIWNTKKGWRYRILNILDLSEYTTEANCRAALLIHLLETNQITPEQVNNHLNP